MPASLKAPDYDGARYQMNRATPRMRILADRIIAFELAGSHSEASLIRSAMPLPERLRPPLSTLMGAAGFRGLLVRALTLAGVEVPWLRAVRVDDDGSLDGWMQPYAQLTPEKFHEGRVVLLAQLLGLLVTFIGERLTLRLLVEQWPKLNLAGVDFGGGTHGAR